MQGARAQRNEAANRRETLPGCPVRSARPSSLWTSRHRRRRGCRTGRTFFAEMRPYMVNVEDLDDSRRKRSIRAGTANDPARHKPAHPDDAGSHETAGRCGAGRRFRRSWGAESCWSLVSPEPIRVLGGGDPPAGGASSGEQRVGNDPCPRPDTGCASSNGVSRCFLTARS